MFGTPAALVAAERSWIGRRRCTASLLWMRVDVLEKTSRPVGRLVRFCSLDRHLRLSSRGHRYRQRGNWPRQLQEEKSMTTSGSFVMNIGILCRDSARPDAE